MYTCMHLFSMEAVGYWRNDFCDYTIAQPPAGGSTYCLLRELRIYMESLYGKELFDRSKAVKMILFVSVVCTFDTIFNTSYCAMF